MRKITGRVTSFCIISSHCSRYILVFYALTHQIVFVLFFKIVAKGPNDNKFQALMNKIMHFTANGETSLHC